MNKNLLTAVVVFAAVLGFAFVGNKVIIDKVAERVIEKLQREYSPGPYQPGFDPDKVNPDFFRNQPAPQMPPQGPPMSPQYQPQQPQMPPQYGLGRPEDWNQMWENQRR